MARIKKEDHARILHLVDVERRAVREIATEFGCTAANIYSLLAKLRRGTADASAGTTAPADEGEAGLPEAALAQPVLGLEPKVASWDIEAPMTLAVEPVLETREPERPMPEKPAPAPAKLAIVASARTSAAPKPSAEPTPAPERRPVLGARLSKPGMGLVMRTEDGEETITPFRSMDDLLSAIKPILRASARSADAVWFSLQPVDLSAIEVDAA